PALARPSRSARELRPTGSDHEPRPTSARGLGLRSGAWSWTSLGDRRRELLPGSAKAGVDGVAVDAQGVGDLGAGHALGLGQDEDHAPRLIEGGEELLDEAG